MSAPIDRRPRRLALLLPKGTRVALRVERPAFPDPLPRSPADGRSHARRAVKLACAYGSTHPTYPTGIQWDSISGFNLGVSPKGSTREDQTVDIRGYIAGVTTYSSSVAELLILAHANGAQFSPRAQLSPLGLSYRLSGSAVASRAPRAPLATSRSELRRLAPHRPPRGLITRSGLSYR